MVVDEVEVEARVVVDVLERLSDVGGDLDSRDPGGEDGEVGVSRVPEAVGEVGTGGVDVDEVEVLAGDSGAKQPDEADVVAPADLEEETVELRLVDSEAEFAADDDSVGSSGVAGEGAAPGGGGEAVGEEVVGSGGDVGEGV